MPRSDSPQENLSNPAAEIEEPSEDEEEASQQITGPRLVPREWLPPGPYVVYTYYMENAHGQWPEKPPVRRLSISRVDKIETDMTGLINPTTPSKEELARFAREKELRRQWDEKEKYLSRHDRIRTGDALLIAHGYPKDKIPNIPTEAYEDIVRISDDDDRGPVSDEEVYLAYGDWSEDARFKVNLSSIEIKRPQEDETYKSGL
ncbi:hypothetical protein COL516b_004072 [Colletotrichum fioriniae]|nr:uncharacterized protein COL516b_004072 [Colletotrichum fioriniae]KAJ0307458.1 hypothetical protein COL516b_004072 [Colletotrichum fioriniae]